MATSYRKSGWGWDGVEQFLQSSIQHAHLVWFCVCLEILTFILFFYEGCCSSIQTQLLCTYLHFKAGHLFILSSDAQSPKSLD